MTLQLEITGIMTVSVFRGGFLNNFLVRIAPAGYADKLGPYAI